MVKEGETATWCRSFYFFTVCNFLMTIINIYTYYGSCHKWRHGVIILLKLIIVKGIPQTISSYAKGQWDYCSPMVPEQALVGLLKPAFRTAGRDVLAFCLIIDNSSEQLRKKSGKMLGTWLKMALSLHRRKDRTTALS